MKALRLILLLSTVVVFSCSDTNSILKNGECENCITLKYGEDNTFREDYRIKVENIIDNRCLVCPQCRIAYPFSADVKIYNSTTDTILTVPGYIDCGGGNLVPSESLFSDSSFIREVFGYQIAIYDVRPVRKSFQDAIALKDYVIEFAVKKK